jgi:copper chaperone
MEPMKFKTNIKCSACVATVTPYLNDSVGEGKWTVDLASPERILSVDSETDPTSIQEALKKAGYKAEKQ